MPSVRNQAVTSFRGRVAGSDSPSGSRSSSANLAREMPVRAVARILGEHDTRLWRIVNHRSEAPEGFGEGSQLL